MMGGMDATCASDSSSIEGCTNSIWEDYQIINYTTEGLKSDPENPNERLKNIRKTQSGLTSKIELLGSASTYKREPFFADCYTTSEVTWEAIDRCKTQLLSARHGIKLLSETEVVDTLSFSGRERLKVAYRKQAARYMDQLDRFAASWIGDPSILCSETYASVPQCMRAVAMDTDALNRQVFPVYRCGRVVPGQFVNATSAAAEEAQHANDTPSEKMLREMFTPLFSATVRAHQDRLQKEESLLSQTPETH
jgi:hypothetical protein